MKQIYKQKPKKKSQGKYWSDHVTKHSNALDLEKGLFTWSDSRKIALSLKQSAEQSTRRKAKPFASAMSMLNFYINRAGRNLKPQQKTILHNFCSSDNLFTSFDTHIGKI